VTRSYAWDALNRLVRVNKDPGPSTTLIATYTYDALGRRIRKVVSNDGLSGNIPNGTTDYIYQGVQCIEERIDVDTFDTPVRQIRLGPVHRRVDPNA
jgi:YD repeat-containing protein